MDEALAAWKGFLWTPRLYAPLLRILKPDLLQTVHHYLELGDVGKQYASVLVLSGLEPADVFSPGELRAATRLLPPEGLQAGAEMLVRAQEGAGDKKPEYWRNRVRPYLDSIWPKTEASRTPEVSKDLSRLCIATGDAFPEAVQRVRPWLRPIQDFGYLVNMLAQTDYCRRFPDPALADSSEFGRLAESPYDLALKFTLEPVVHFLEGHGETALPVVAESRGRIENADLERMYFRIMNQGTYYRPKEQFKKLDCPLVFRSKMDNIAGIQIADLCAYPCARHVLAPGKQNMAFEAIYGHLYRREVVFGMKVFP